MTSYVGLIFANYREVTDWVRQQKWGNYNARDKIFTAFGGQEYLIIVPEYNKYLTTKFSSLLIISPFINPEEIEILFIRVRK